MPSNLLQERRHEHRWKVAPVDDVEEHVPNPSTPGLAVQGYGGRVAVDTGVVLVLFDHLGAGAEKGSSLRTHRMVSGTPR
jgi:hypothetical protein